jgi:hypothetical protein
MAMYTANNPNRILTLHKEGCVHIPKGLSPCGCGSTSAHGYQRWYCENHVSIPDVNQFRGERFWAILVCSECFNAP